MEKQPRTRLVGVGVEVVYPRGIEGAGPADKPVYLIPLSQQKLHEVGAVLTGRTCNECSFQLASPRVLVAVIGYRMFTVPILHDLIIPL